MKSFLDNEIKHLPTKRILVGDRMYLGYVDSYDCWLVVEEWEFRIYNYEYWSRDSIQDWEHEDETWWSECDTYFAGPDGCFDTDTCEYVVAEFDSDKPEVMAEELLARCDLDLEDVSYRISDNNEPSVELINFIKSGLEKIGRYDGSLVYQYYK